MPEDSIGIVTLNDYTFEKFKDKTKYLVVKFHIPGCHHCQTFKETYDDLVLSMSFDPDAENIKFAQVNCMDMDSLEACSDEGVAGFPALHIYKVSLNVNQPMQSMLMKMTINFRMEILRTSFLVKEQKRVLKSLFGM